MHVNLSSPLSTTEVYKAENARNKDQLNLKKISDQFVNASRSQLIYKVIKSAKKHTKQPEVSDFPGLNFSRNNTELSDFTDLHLSQYNPEVILSLLSYREDDLHPVLRQWQQNVLVLLENEIKSLKSEQREKLLERTMLLPQNATELLDCWKAITLDQSNSTRRDLFLRSYDELFNKNSSVEELTEAKETIIKARNAFSDYNQALHRHEWKVQFPSSLIQLIIPHALFSFIPSGVVGHTLLSFLKGDISPSILFERLNKLSSSVQNVFDISNATHEGTPLTTLTQLNDALEAPRSLINMLAGIGALINTSPAGMLTALTCSAIVSGLSKALSQKINNHVGQPSSVSTQTLTELYRLNDNVNYLNTLFSNLIYHKNEEPPIMGEDPYDVFNEKWSKLSSQERKILFKQYSKIFISLTPEEQSKVLASASDVRGEQRRIFEVISIIAPHDPKIENVFLETIAVNTAETSATQARVPTSEPLVQPVNASLTGDVMPLHNEKNIPARFGALTQEGIETHDNMPGLIFSGVNAASIRPLQKPHQMTPAQTLAEIDKMMKTVSVVNQAASSLNIEQSALRFAQKILKKFNITTPANEIFLIQFHNAMSDENTSTHYAHVDGLKNIKTLVEFILCNVTPKQYELGDLSTLDTYSGFYTSINSTLYGKSNEVRIPPSKFAEVMNEMDFQKTYIDEVSDYFKKLNIDDRATQKFAALAYLVKSNLSQQAKEQVLRAAAPDLVRKLNQDKTAFINLTENDLKATFPAGKNVRQLDIYGYPTSFIIFGIQNGGQVLYSPVSNTFIEFNNMRDLLENIIKMTHDSAGRNYILKHANIYYQRNGRSYSGIKEFVVQSGLNNPSWVPTENPLKYLQMNNVAIKDDVFDHISEVKKNDLITNAKELIVSPKELAMEVSLEDINTMSSFLALASPLAGIELMLLPIGLQFGAGSIAMGEASNIRSQKLGENTLINGLINAALVGAPEIVNGVIKGTKQASLLFENLQKESIGSQYEYEMTQMSQTDLHTPLDLTDAVPASDVVSSTANEVSIMKLDKTDYFVKPPAKCMYTITPEGNFELGGMPSAPEQAYLASKETASADYFKLMAMHKNAAPETFVAIKKSSVGTSEFYVASKKVNFLEFADALADDNFIGTVGNKINIGDKAKFAADSEQFKALYADIKSMKNADSEPKWYAETNPEVNSIRQEKIRALRVITRNMVGQLPREMKKELLNYIISGQLIGEQDIINAWLENLGFDENYHIVSVDHGSSFGNAFAGNAMNDVGASTAALQRPYILNSGEPYTAVSFEENPSFKYGVESDINKTFYYPEDVRMISIVADDPALLDEVLKEMALKSRILKGAGGTDSAFTKVLSQLRDVPEGSTLEKYGHFSKDHIIKVMGGRTNELLQQAESNGGLNEWVKRNPKRAQEIINMANQQREELGLRNVYFGRQNPQGSNVHIPTIVASQIIASSGNKTLV